MFLTDVSDTGIATLYSLNCTDFAKDTIVVGKWYKLMMCVPVTLVI